MFKILTFTVLLGLAAAASASSLSKERPRSDLTCELCTLVLTAADTLIARNETEDKIISFIEKNLCGRLGSLNGTCTQFMETEGKQILYQLSQGIHPAVICKTIGLCNARQAEARKLVITQVDNMLKNNASEAQILSFIEQYVCNVAGKESQLCKTIIDGDDQASAQLNSLNQEEEKGFQPGLYFALENSEYTKQTFNKTAYVFTKSNGDYVEFDFGSLGSEIINLEFILETIKIGNRNQYNSFNIQNGQIAFLWNSFTQTILPTVQGILPTLPIKLNNLSIDKEYDCTVNHNTLSIDMTSHNFPTDLGILSL